MNEIFVYVLAAAQQKHGVENHAFVCMSNHLHLVLTDVRGALRLLRLAHPDAGGGAARG